MELLEVMIAKGVSEADLRRSLENDEVEMELSFAANQIFTANDFETFRVTGRGYPLRLASTKQ